MNIDSSHQTSLQQLQQSTQPSFLEPKSKKMVTLYFNNNPAYLDHGYNTMYRNCVLCGSERFNDSDWSKILEGKSIKVPNVWGKQTTICLNNSCKKVWDRIAKANLHKNADFDYYCLKHTSQLNQKSD